jgi:hypothetical protein
MSKPLVSAAFAAQTDLNSARHFKVVTMTREEILYLTKTFKFKEVFPALRKILTTRGLSYSRLLGITTWWEGDKYCCRNFYLPKELLPDTIKE